MLLSTEQGLTCRRPSACVPWRWAGASCSRLVSAPGAKRLSSVTQTQRRRFELMQPFSAGHGRTILLLPAARPVFFPPLRIPARGVFPSGLTHVIAPALSRCSTGQPLYVCSASHPCHASRVMFAAFLPCPRPPGGRPVPSTGASLLPRSPSLRHPKPPFPSGIHRHFFALCHPTSPKPTVPRHPSPAGAAQSPLCVFRCMVYFKLNYISSCHRRMVGHEDQEAGERRVFCCTSSPAWV